jgi:hypothetical protein
MIHEIYYALSWMLENIVGMKLALSSLVFQKAYNILFPTLGSNPILSTFFSLSLLEKHVHPL